MLAAIAAATAGAKVVIIDHLPQPGRKLLATGGGHCNLTNMLDEGEFLAAFGRQGRFLQPALALFDREQLLAFLSDIGLPTHCPDDFRVYPTSNSAADVVQTLWSKCLALGVQPMLATEVTAIVTEEVEGHRHVVGVRTGGGGARNEPQALAMNRWSPPMPSSSPPAESPIPHRRNGRLCPGRAGWTHRHPARAGAMRWSPASHGRRGARA